MPYSLIKNGNIQKIQFQGTSYHVEPQICTDFQDISVSLILINTALTLQKARWAFNNSS